MNSTQDILQVPAFARLDDYCGLWLVEPIRFRAMLDGVKRVDLQAHMQAHADEKLHSATEMVNAGGGKSIAMVKLAGLLMKGQSSMGGTSTVQARREIRSAANDPEVGGILIVGDSPGGTVAGTADLAADIKLASRQKPVWGHIEDLGASAFYWAVSQTQRITVNAPTALVGSIGTVQVVYDQSAAAEREGIRPIVISTGPLKGLGAPGAKVTDEQIAHLQGIVNAVQESFDAAVQKGRGLSSKELAAVRHGGVMTANAALGAKLVDGVQPLAKTLAELAQSIKSGAKPGMRAEALLPTAAAKLLPMRI